MDCSRATDESNTIEESEKEDENVNEIVEETKSSKPKVAFSASFSGASLTLMILSALDLAKRESILKCKSVNIIGISIRL